MKELLSQNWYVARRQALLWICCAGTLILAFLIIADNPDSQVAPGLGIVYAFFAAVYLGETGTSGRLDSQIIHGCARFRVYLALLLTLVWCFWLILLCALAGELAGHALNGTLDEITASGALLNAGGLMLNAAAYASIFALVGLLLVGRRPGRGTILLIVSACLVLFFAIWGSTQMDRLMQPEFDTVIEMGDFQVVSWYDGDLPDGSGMTQVPNPDYVREPERSQIEQLVRAIPVTQCLVLHNFTVEEPNPQLLSVAFQTYLYSILLAAACCAAGMLFFQRRELD